MISLRLAMVQMNAIVGDVQGNVRAMVRWIREAKHAKADVVVFPELAVPGYPPEDLLLMPDFLRETKKSCTALVGKTKGIMAVVGNVDVVSGPPPARKKSWSPPQPNLLNTAWVMADGRVWGVYAKQKLPNYGVFDEQRYFQPGTTAPVFRLGTVHMGVNICEDIWSPHGPVRDQALWGRARLVLNINASPYHLGKTHERQRLLADQAKAHRVFVSYTNMVGGQDELVFDGNSVVLDPSGEIMARGKAFEEDLVLVDLPVETMSAAGRRGTSSRPGKKTVPVVVIPWRPKIKNRPSLVTRQRSLPASETEEVYRALVMGVADYVRKNQFSRVVIGISGGIDSALTAAIARDALGPGQVLGVIMPSHYTSTESLQDARALAHNLRIRLLNLPITRLFKAYLQLLKKPFLGLPADTTEENLQARIRGTLLMALSNKFGDLVLTTGNKSEMSVGYATLYGDMAGGFAVIKDVPKMMVYRLAKWRSEWDGPGFDRITIPERIQTRAPSAELKPDQTDQDSLPPYATLDAILEAYVEHNRPFKRIVRNGYSPEVVKTVMRMVDKSEYKRRQAPLGVKITPRALGKDRRMPITNRFTSDVQG
jgi:NAD+ synthase (glutamine-hydrolysing)